MQALFLSMQPLCKQIPTNLIRKSKATESVITYMAKDELDKLLIEATANENWNISNTKML